MVEMDYPVSPLRRPAVAQFVKFCIIGLTSTVIDVGILNLLTQKFGMFWIAAGTISFLFAVTNGYIWNSLWTFRGMGSGKRHEQYIKFVAVNIVGFVLNIAIMKLMLMALSGGGHSGAPSPLHLNIAKGIAVVVVSTWNFVANRKWTFA